MSKALCCAAKSEVRSKGALTFPMCPTKPKVGIVKVQGKSLLCCKLLPPSTYRVFLEAVHVPAVVYIGLRGALKMECWRGR